MLKLFIMNELFTLIQFEVLVWVKYNIKNTSGSLNRSACSSVSGLLALRAEPCVCGCMEEQVSHSWAALSAL